MSGDRWTPTQRESLMYWTPWAKTKAKGTRVRFGVPITAPLSFDDRRRWADALAGEQAENEWCPACGYDQHEHGPGCSRGARP